MTVFGIGGPIFYATALSLLLQLNRCAATPFSLSNTIGDSMVLQRDTVLSTLWGFAAPGAVVSTALDCVGCPSVPGATAGADGVWRATVPPLAATAAPFNISFSTPGETTLALSDVLVGDVLLCSGQSNQQVSISMALNASAEIAALPQYGATVRIFYAAEFSSSAPLVDLPAPAMAWARLGAGAGAASWRGFSATCWYTGRSLWAALGRGAVPVGLVESSVGGTAVRQWAPIEALAACPQPYNAPAPYGTKPYAHAELFNGMVAPYGTGPTQFRAIVFDQAESDSFPQTPVGYYGCQTAAMVPAWRALLGAAALPFVFVHLQPYTGADGLEDLRAAQLVALSHGATGVATAIDLGDPDSPFGNVHFRNKQVIGDRLATALRALAGDAAASQLYPPASFLSQVAYNDSSGAPVVDVAFFRPGAPRGAPALQLALLPAPACPPTANCTTFQILASDGGAYDANAALAAGGFGLRITAPSLPNGVYAVGSAYAWSQWPLATLYSQGGLPVLPWRQALTLAGPPGPPPS